MYWDAKAIILIIITVVNCIVLFTLKFNDLHHLEKDVRELKDKDIPELKSSLHTFGKRLYNHAQRIARLEGRVDRSIKNK